jgi:hypothetical protein
VGNGDTGVFARRQYFRVQAYTTTTTVANRLYQVRVRVHALDRVCNELRMLQRCSTQTAVTTHPTLAQPTCHTDQYTQQPVEFSPGNKLRTVF